MYNKIILVGNLTKDPVLRYTPKGTPVATVSLAVNTVVSSQRETLFIDVIVFGKHAEACSEYLAKGRMVLVEGRLIERRWLYDGLQRRKFEVVANQIKFMPKSKDQTEQAYDQEIDIEELESMPEEMSEHEPF